MGDGEDRERCAKCGRPVFDRGAEIREAMSGPATLNVDQADAAIIAACECRKVCANCHLPVFLPSVADMRADEGLRAWVQRLGRCACAQDAKVPTCATCLKRMAKCECAARHGAPVAYGEHGWVDVGRGHEAEATPAGGTAPNDADGTARDGEQCAKCGRPVFDRGAEIRAAMSGTAGMTEEQAAAAVIAACECRKVCANCRRPVFLPSALTMRGDDATRQWIRGLGECVCAPHAKVPTCATCLKRMAKCECEAEATPAGGTAPSAETPRRGDKDEATRRACHEGLSEAVLFLRSMVLSAVKGKVGVDTGVAAAAAMVSAVRELRFERRERKREADKPGATRV